MLLEKIINNQSFETGLRFKGNKDTGTTSKQAVAETKATSETLGKILREIKNVKGQQDKMREEICGRQNNLESELSRIREAIEEAAIQEEKRTTTDTPSIAPIRPMRTRTHQPHTTHTKTHFETSMEGVTLEDVQIDTDIPRCDDGGNLVYIDEIGTYDYACWEDMVDFYRSKNWTFPEKKVWAVERKKAIEDWKIKEKEGIIALRKAEKEAEEKKGKKEQGGLEKSTWADQVEEQAEEMELDSWSGVTVKDGIVVAKPKEDKGKGRATRTPTPPPQNFDFDKARNHGEESSVIDIETVNPAHNFDPSKVITTKSNPTVTAEKPRIGGRAPVNPGGWGQPSLAGVPPRPLARTNQQAGQSNSQQGKYPPPVRTTFAQIARQGADGQWNIVQRKNIPRTNPADEKVVPINWRKMVLNRRPGTGSPNVPDAEIHSIINRTLYAAQVPAHIRIQEVKRNYRGTLTITTTPKCSGNMVLNVTGATEW